LLVCQAGVVPDLAATPASRPTTPASGERRRPAPFVVRVEDVQRLSDGMLRIVFGGKGLAAFEPGPFTDSYVKLHLPPPGADYTVPFDPAEIRATLPSEQWSRTRTYTVRAWDGVRRLLTIDFVVHGDEGLAGPWAAAAAVGDLAQLSGPGGGYAPDPAVGHHLFIGDEAVLPAIAVSLGQLSAGQRATVIAQVPSELHRLELLSPGGGAGADVAVDVVWLEGFETAPVLDALATVSFDPADTQAFVHGEATMVRLVRRELAVGRGLPLARLSASGYWKQDLTDERWRAEKRDWIAAADADVAGTVG
jgi:NADPH-dependent ferric siderophore reductase